MRAMARHPYTSSEKSLWCDGRHVVDLLPDTFALDRSESEWLMTLLGAGELRYIFEGMRDDEGQG